MNFVIGGLLVVLIISFFVLVWKAARDWRWYQIVPVIFTMLLAVTLIFPTARVLKCRVAWHKIKEQLEERFERISAEQKVIKYGEPTVQNAEGIVQLSQKLGAVNMEAGRRWRNLRMTNVTNTSLTLSLPQQAPDPVAAADPAAAAPAAPAGAMVPVDLVLYGFSETLDQQLQTAIPTTFVAEFKVTASTPNDVTLAPNGPLAPEQIALVNQAQQQGRTWTLYEMLPLDGHDPFIAPGSAQTDDEFFGHVDEDLVRRLLGQGTTEETIQNYLRDGSRALPDDPPLSRWEKIEFLKKYSMQVDSPDQRGALDGTFFDGNGRAVDSRLQRGEFDADGKFVPEDIVFNVGDQILVKEEEGKKLRADGTARLIDQYYIRPMNDYRFVLRRIRLQLAELENRMKELAFEKAVLDEAIALTVKMLTINQEVKLKLEQDLAQVKVEAKAIAEYKAKNAKQVEELRAEMIRLHRENQTLEAQLEKHHFDIQKKLDSVTMK